MTDIIMTIGGSMIQHGPASNRIYLMKLDVKDLPDLLGQLNELATEKGYTKIFAKVPAPYATVFFEEGYRREGTIPGFYKGKVDAAFLGKFIDPAREITPQRDKLEKIIALAQGKSGGVIRPLPPHYTVRRAEESDAGELASLYREVFASYPFPIHDPGYLIETMRTHICYFLVEQAGRIVAAASGEMDCDALNAEMTDFATQPDHLGNGLAVHLLREMEPVMAQRGIRTLYTIARAVSPGMNITFAKCGYILGGTLIHNTQISGSIESMNLWYRATHRCTV